MFNLGICVPFPSMIGGKDEGLAWDFLLEIETSWNIPVWLLLSAILAGVLAIPPIVANFKSWKVAFLMPTTPSHRFCIPKKQRKTYGCFRKWWYPQNDQNGWFEIWKTLLNWMIWGYPYFWKHPYQVRKSTLTFWAAVPAGINSNLVFRRGSPLCISKKKQW